MKIVIISLFVLFTYNLTSQNKIINIEYEVFYNTDLPNIKKANLYIDNSKSRSIYKLTIPKKGEENATIDEENNSVNMRFASEKQEYNYFDFKKDSLYSSENILGEDFLVIEQIPEITWTLVEEEKTIDGNRLFKATGYFRGRNYTAWYSLEYPFKSGPWKFHGLPGLIFEVYDETKRYNWLIKNISYEDALDKEFVMKHSGMKVIDTKEYVERKYNDNMGFARKLAAQLQRGARIVEENSNRAGLEIKFEWEE